MKKILSALIQMEDIVQWFSALSGMAILLEIAEKFLQNCKKKSFVQKHGGESLENVHNKLVYVIEDFDSQILNEKVWKND